MAHISTIKLLIAWAKWGQGQSIDYPSLSPMFGERALKTPLYGHEHMPDDVALVELAVCRLEWCDRDMLIMRYQRHLTFVQMGQRLSRSRWTAKSWLRRAEDNVQYEINCRNAPTSVYPSTGSKTV